MLCKGIGIFMLMLMASFMMGLRIICQNLYVLNMRAISLGWLRGVRLMGKHKTFYHRSVKRFRQENNPEIARVNANIDVLRKRGEWSRCPKCGAEGTLLTDSDYGYSAQCLQCDTRWSHYWG
jgi:hypothetical protein